MTDRVRLSQIMKVFVIQDLTLSQLLVRSGVQDWATGALALLAAVGLCGRWLPSIALVLAGGFVGWLASL